MEEKKEERIFHLELDKLKSGEYGDWEISYYEIVTSTILSRALLKKLIPYYDIFIIGAMELYMQDPSQNEYAKAITYAKKHGKSSDINEITKVAIKLHPQVYLDKKVAPRNTEHTEAININQKRIDTLKEARRIWREMFIEEPQKKSELTENQKKDIEKAKEYDLNLVRILRELDADMAKVKDFDRQAISYAKKAVAQLDRAAKTADAGDGAESRK